MSWQIFIPAFILGLVSSFHCIGMCGPIALLLPVESLAPSKRTIGIILYNLGRVSTYTGMGLFFGWLGRGIFIAGYQQYFSVFLGVVILATAVGYIMQKRIGRNYLESVLVKNVQSAIARQMNRKGLMAMYLVGLANGFLPCGMVYFAIAGALATGTVWGGGIFMAVFGLGTLPLMLLLLRFAGFITANLRGSVKVVIPYIIALMGIALIMRGLNLDIPYLSPFFSKVNNEIISCH